MEIEVDRVAPTELSAQGFLQNDARMMTPEMIDASLLTRHISPTVLNNNDMEILGGKPERDDIRLLAHLDYDQEQHSEDKVEIVE